MPFDGTKPNPVVDLLDKMEALLDGGKNWCQDRFEDDNGRLCIIGALRKAAGGTALCPPEYYLESEAYEALRLAIGMEPAIFNDRCSTTYQDIKRALDKAREIAREGEYSAARDRAEIEV